LTAVSAIVFFLGLLFGFQRPSRLLLPRLRATVLLLLGCTPFNFGAAFFISKRLFCQAAVAASLHRFTSPGLTSSCRGGAEPTSLPPPVSTRFVDSFFRLAAAFAASRGGGFYHRRVWSQLRSSTSYFVFHCFVRGLRRQCDFAFPSEGARLLSPRPGGVNRLRRLSSSLRHASVAVATSALSRGAASTTAASGVNSVLPTPYSVFQPDQENPPPLRLRLPVRGARLLPPPRLESTRFFDSIFPMDRPGERGARPLREFHPANTGDRSSPISAAELSIRSARRRRCSVQS
jgi:hypothetical protein